MDQKRYIFSRFYFISDPVLLEILGQASNSHVIQPYLLSLFDNISRLTYSPTEYDKALEIVSKEGEGIPLEHPVLCVGGVENWLNVLLNESKNSVNQILTNVANYMIDDPTFTLLTMVEKFQSQVLRYNFFNNKRVFFYLNNSLDGFSWHTNVMDILYRKRD